MSDQSTFHQSQLFSSDKSTRNHYYSTDAKEYIVQQIKDILDSSDQVKSTQDLGLAITTLANKYAISRSTLASGTDEQHLANQMSVLNQIELICKYLDTLFNAIEKTAIASATGGGSLAQNSSESVQSILGAITGIAKTVATLKINQNQHHLASVGRLENMRQAVILQEEHLKKIFHSLNALKRASNIHAKKANILLKHLSRLSPSKRDSKLMMAVEFCQLILENQRMLHNTIDQIMSDTSTQHYHQLLKQDSIAITGLNQKSFAKDTENYFKFAKDIGLNESTLALLLTKIRQLKRHNGSPISTHKMDQLHKVLSNALEECKKLKQEHRATDSTCALILLIKLDKALIKAGVDQQTIQEIAELLNEHQLGDLLRSYNQVINLTHHGRNDRLFIQDLLSAHVNESYLTTTPPYFKRDSIFTSVYNLGNKLDKQLIGTAGTHLSQLNKVKNELLTLYLYQQISAKIPNSLSHHLAKSQLLAHLAVMLMASYLEHSHSAVLEHLEPLANPTILNNRAKHYRLSTQHPIAYKDIEQCFERVIEKKNEETNRSDFPTFFAQPLQLGHKTRLIPNTPWLSNNSLPKSAHHFSRPARTG